MPIKIKRVQTSDRNINQLQQNIATAVEPLFSSTTGYFTLTLTGCTSTTISAQGKYQIVPGSGQVTLSLPSLSGTSNSTSATLTGLPAQLWAKSNPPPGTALPYTSFQPFLMPIVNNGSASVATAYVTSLGTIVLTTDLTGNAAAGFTASGTKGCYACNVTYQTGL